MLDVGEGHGAGADVERAVGDGGGQLGELLDEVAAGDRADAAADDLQARRAQCGGRDRGVGPATEPIWIQVSGALRSARA